MLKPEDATPVTPASSLPKSDSGANPMSYPKHQHKHFYPQVWLLIFSLSAFAFAIMWDLGWLQAMTALDKSYLTLVILGLLVLSSCHALWHIVRYSQYIELLRRFTEINHVSGDSAQEINLAYCELLQLKIQAAKSTRVSKLEREAVAEVFAENRRAAVDLGWFLVDLAIRLGLVGTIIGFILIFTSLTNITIDGADGLKELMIAMSGGMGTALFTTLCGLVAGMLMSLQYLVLGRQTEHLVGLLIRCNTMSADDGEDP